MSRLFDPRAFRSGVREWLPVSLALLPFGLVCGVAAAEAGASLAEAMGLSAFVFSGAAQILATQLYAAGAPVAVIVLGCAVIGLRLLMYSAALAPHFAPLPPAWRNAMAFVVTDQSFAAGIRRFEAEGAAGPPASHFLGTGLALWAGWQVSNLAGYLAGNVIPAGWSLDFAVPLCFIAVLAPLYRERTMVFAGVVSGVAVLLLADLPMRLNLVVAGLAGIAAGALAESLAARRRL